jgi:3-phenylpropionate/cinnamic acid dioxygenase small subunit
MAEPPIVLADELAIRRTLAAYCHHLDDGDFSGLAHQFTEDGSYTYGSTHTSGRAELESWFAEMNPAERRGKHLSTNVVVDMEGDQAVASSDYLFLRIVDGTVTPVFTGRYRDELVRAESGWLIRSRVVTPLT